MRCWCWWHLPKGVSARCAVRRLQQTFVCAHKACCLSESIHSPSTCVAERATAGGEQRDMGDSSEAAQICVSMLWRGWQTL